MKYAITHNDLDGMGCAVLLEKVFGEEILIFPVDYKEIDRTIDLVFGQANPEDRVFITDISLNEDLAEKCDTRGNIQHIDHHKSSKKISDKYPWSFTDISHCATYHLFNIISKYAYLDDYKPFVELVNNYDTWGGGEGPTEEAKDLNRYLYSVGEETFVKRFVKSPSLKMNETETAIIMVDKIREAKYIEEAIESAVMCQDPQGYDFVFVAAEQYISSLGHALLQRCEDNVDYVVMYSAKSNKISLRSKNIDVSEIAKQCGGGGHKNAAGFILPQGSLQVLSSLKYFTGADE